MSVRLIRATTENSEYEIDEFERTVTRFPNVGGLRRDGQALPFVAIGEPTEGEPLKMVLLLRPDGVPTYRVTSPVLRVEVACAWCDQFNMDEMTCPNAKDICTDCCGED